MPDTNITHAIAEMVRKMPDAQIAELVKGHLDRGTVPEPEPRRKPRKMRKVGPKTGKRPPAKFAKDANGKPKLSANEKKALKAVTDARSPITVGEVAKKIKLTHGATHGLLRRMAKKGLLKEIAEGKGSKRPKRLLYEAN